MLPGQAGAHAADRPAEDETAGVTDTASDLPASGQEAGDEGGLSEGDGVCLRGHTHGREE